MKLKALAAVAAATPLMVACGSAEKTSFKLNGAGATFPAPLYNAWFASFAKETGSQVNYHCLLYTSPSPRDATLSRMPSSA